MTLQSKANVTGGTVDATWGSTNLGAVRGAVTVQLNETTLELFADDVGETPIADIITGRSITVTLPLTETQVANIVNMIGNTSLVEDAAKDLVNVTTDVGTNLVDSAQKLTLKPVSAGVASTDANTWFTVWLATPMATWSFNYSLTDQRIYEVPFKGYVDTENSKRLYAFGDTTASADTTPPTITTETPTDGAAAQATSVTPSLVFSESMKQSTLEDLSNFFFMKSDGTAVTFTVAVSTTTNTNDTVTLTPGSALDASSTYIWGVTTGVTDTAGNALAATTVYDFATA